MEGETARQQTFIMIKPDGVQRGLIGEVISRLEKKGYKLNAIKYMVAEKAHVEEHYSDLSSKKFFNDLVEYVTSGPVVAMVWEGKDIVGGSRLIIGATNPTEATPGTIRGDLCIDVGRNIIHGSDSVENAEKEIKHWFGESGITSWKSHSEGWIYE